MLGKETNVMDYLSVPGVKVLDVLKRLDRNIHHLWISGCVYVYELNAYSLEFKLFFPSFI